MGALMATGNGLAGQSGRGGALPQLYAATPPDVASGDYYGPDGPFEMRGDPSGRHVGRRPRRRRRRAPVAFSEELTGVTYAW